MIAVSEELLFLGATAASVGFVHALVGPDHYLPFITLARARQWSAARTAGVTLACGAGHVAGSILLGSLGIALGWTLGGFERVEALRGALAGWLLLGFGLAYLAWGLRQAQRARPHSHWHSHADGTLHTHQHTHVAAHAHVHESTSEGRPGPIRRMTPWALFLIFVLGPCEPLIPLLMIPSSIRDWTGIAVVAAAFAVATLITMTSVVLAGRLGAARLPDGSWQRWAHASAGLVIALCGLAIQLGL
ncbi:MAG: hypothetical protein GY769_24525 [bacterium]|nr:hypothetical protein [bacterium]